MREGQTDGGDQTGNPRKSSTDLCVQILKTSVGTQSRRIVRRLMGTNESEKLPEEGAWGMASEDEGRNKTFTIRVSIANQLLIDDGNVNRKTIQIIK